MNAPTITKAQLLSALAAAYDFPEDFGHNLDAADDLLNEIAEEKKVDKLSPEPIFEVLLRALPEQEREGCMALLGEWFFLRVG